MTESRILPVLVLLLATLFGMRLADRLIDRYRAKLSSALPLTSLTQNLAKAVILVIGTLMILQNMGVSITPILTALGIGGLAIALALQDTLSNLFSGIYVTMARQIRIGDYIRLDSGEEGVVSDIAWRSARIQSGAGNLIIVPNVKLAQAIITNFNLPNRDLAVPVEMGAAFDGDLEKIERMTLEVAQEVMKQVPGGVANFQPLVRFHGVGEYSLKFTVVLRAQSFADQPLVKHEFIKRAAQRYRREGIQIPIAQQVPKGS